MHCKPVKGNKVWEGGLWRSGWNTGPQGTRSTGRNKWQSGEEGRCLAHLCSQNSISRSVKIPTPLPGAGPGSTSRAQPTLDPSDQYGLDKRQNLSFNSLLLRLSRVIMLTSKITVWYDHVHIELTHRTSELLSCDSVQTAASERVLYLSSCPSCRDNPPVLNRTVPHKPAQVTVETLQSCLWPGSSWLYEHHNWGEVFQRELFAGSYRKSFLCVPSTSKKYLVKT